MNLWDKLALLFKHLSCWILIVTFLDLKFSHTLRMTDISLSLGLFDSTTMIQSAPGGCVQWVIALLMSSKQYRGYRLSRCRWRTMERFWFLETCSWREWRRLTAVTNPTLVQASILQDPYSFCHYHSSLLSSPSHWQGTACSPAPSPHCPRTHDPIISSMLNIMVWIWTGSWQVPLVAGAERLHLRLFRILYKSLRIEIQTYYILKQSN